MFSDEDEGSIQVFTIGTDGRNLTQITKGKGARSLFPQWSADGQSLYFYQAQPSASFRIIPANGGPSSEVIAGWRWEKQFGTRVNPDGKLIVYARYNKGVPVATGDPRSQESAETPLNVALDDPKWLPRAGYVVGTELLSSTPPEGDISICPVDGSACRRVTRGYDPVPSRDGSRIYFLRSVETADAADLWSVSLSNLVEAKVARLRPLNPIAHFYDVSRAGEIVWVQLKPGRGELWLWDWSVD